MTYDTDKDHLINTGGRIRAAREARGLNLHELARLSGISASALSLIETGQRDLRLTTLYRVAAALRVSAGDLLEDREDDVLQPTAIRPGGYDLGDYT
ncbi:helix-turn-helix transcriptional regulator [Hyphomonas sp.]|uniref:helix-turn-helix domain-containing protein n=1 Tax=Hyphomonas sp. TaxID=87 RepID=UPI0025BD5675|nr:helix-turn-helix transcriptional regulator [Hyphomonas sp.]MBI1400042.1 helix-turn-helix domain-containing protein [Hyphomonas sp.]